MPIADDEFYLAKNENRKWGLTLLGHLHKGYSKDDQKNSYGSGQYRIGKDLCAKGLRFAGIRPANDRQAQSDRSKAIERCFAEAHGGLISNHIPVYLPYPQKDQFFENWAINYGAGGGAQWYCDRRRICRKKIRHEFTITQRGKQVKRATYRMENVNEPCQYPIDEHASCPLCGLSRKLWVIPRCFYDDRNARASGVVALESTSKNDGRLHQVLAQQLEELRRLFSFADPEEVNFCNVPQKAQMLMLSRETANYVPWILRRVEQNIHVPLIRDGQDTGKQTTKTDWTLDLEVDPDWLARMYQKVEVLQRQWLQGGVIDHNWKHHFVPGSDPMLLPPAFEQIEENPISDNPDIELSTDEVLGEIMADSPRDRLLKVCTQLKLPKEQLGLVSQAIEGVAPGKQADFLSELEYQNVVNALLISWAMTLSSKEVAPDGSAVPLFLSPEEAANAFFEVVDPRETDALKVLSWIENCKFKN